VLLFAGGILYTVGAIFFALHRPNLNPKVFGYHEMWHSMVIGGSVCHYAMILLLAVGAR
jgi:hemolysin III